MCLSGNLKCTFRCTPEWAPRCVCTVRQIIILLHYLWSTPHASEWDVCRIIYYMHMSCVGGIIDKQFPRKAAHKNMVKYPLNLEVETIHQQRRWQKWSCGGLCNEWVWCVVLVPVRVMAVSHAWYHSLRIILCLFLNISYLQRIYLWPLILFKYGWVGTRST